MNYLLPMFSLLFLLEVTLPLFTTESSGESLPSPVAIYFSPEGGIKEQLLQSIKEAKDSIDIAAFQFTSGDLAEALLLAKNRGVRVRLLLDHQESQRPNSLAPFFREQGLEVKSIQGRLGGQMHYTFIIFDSKKVFTGSYSLTESAEKFNHENALFLEGPLLVARYKAHFSKLFGEPLEERPEPARLRRIPSPEETRHFIGLSLFQIQQRLSEDSKLSPAEKDILWSYCQGKYIRGEGEIIRINPDLAKLILKEQDIEIEITLEVPTPSLQAGQRVSYSGRLINRPSTDKTFILDRGTIY